MYERLRHKGFSEEINKKVVDYLISRGYLDDRKFAFDWAEYIVERKMVGKLFLRQELQQKGISKEIIEETTRRIYDQEGRERELAYQLLQKKMAHYKKMESEKRREFSHPSLSWPM